MEEYANKFLDLLRYVKYIKDEKVKIQCFLSGFPQSYKDQIEFYDPRTLEEAIRRAKYCYEKRKRKYNYQKAWPRTFNGEIKNGQEDEAWILGTRKYFQVQGYSRIMKARVAILNLTARASIWWEHFRKVKKINERKIVWK